MYLLVAAPGLTVRLTCGREEEEGEEGAGTLLSFLVIFAARGTTVGVVRVSRAVLVRQSVCRSEVVQEKELLMHGRPAGGGGRGVGCIWRGG